MKLSEFVASYLATALWAETVLLPCDESEIVDGCMDVDDDHPLYNIHECEPLDDYFTVDDFRSDSVRRAYEDCERFLFLVECAGLLEEAHSYGDVAHNFWLTRNGHGAGFWDGDFGDIGDRLTAIAKKFSDCTILVGSDGSLDIVG